MENPVLEERIEMLRGFNRFYTKFVGALNEGLLTSPYSLTEARILYELHIRGEMTASELAGELALDPAYLSRILKKFSSKGLLENRRSDTDRRKQLLSLSPAGEEVYAPLKVAARDEIAGILSKLSESEQRSLLGAADRITSLLGGETRQVAPFIIRPLRSGDMGWIVHRQAVLYWEEYRWGQAFEGLVAEVAGQFLKEHDPRREQCWVAEKGGEILGSIMVVRRDDEVAKLRLLYVEPSARGMGIGRRLVDESIRFARGAGYKRMTLWTNAVLVSARRIYEAAGFRLTAENKHTLFGEEQVGQDWLLDL